MTKAKKQYSIVNLYQRAMVEAFSVIQKAMDEQELHPVATGAIVFRKAPSGCSMKCYIDVDLQPGKTAQSFADWFIKKGTSSLH